MSSISKISSHPTTNISLISSSKFNFKTSYYCCKSSSGLRAKQHICLKVNNQKLFLLDFGQRSSQLPLISDVSEKAPKSSKFCSRMDAQSQLLRVRRAITKRNLVKERKTVINNPTSSVHSPKFALQLLGDLYSVIFI